MVFEWIERFFSKIWAVWAVWRLFLEKPLKPLKSCTKNSSKAAHFTNFLRKRVKPSKGLEKTMWSFMGQSCDFMIRRSWPNFGVSTLSRPKLVVFFRPPRPEIGISRFADRENVSATSANEIKLVALVETLVATLEKFAAAVENLVVAWYFKLVATVKKFVRAVKKIVAR